MHRGIAVGNKICARWEEQRKQDLHRERLRQMRPVTDTSEPFVLQMDHVRNNYKREQMLEERYTEIDRENRILLKKMSDIMKATQSTPRVVDVSGGQSLNRGKRKEELLRITKENQHILKRIQQAQPTMNHIEWEADHRRAQMWAANCAEYPRAFRSPRDLGPRSELVPLQPEMINEHVPSTARVGPSQDRALSDTPGTDNMVKVVLEERRQIGDVNYDVEMSTDGGDLFISAHNAASQLRLDFIVKDKIHRKIFRETNGAYDQLAQRLQIISDEHGARLLLEDDGSQAALSARGPQPRGPHASPQSARSEGGRAAKAAEGVRDRTAAYMQSNQGAQLKSPSPPVRSPPPAKSPDDTATGGKQPQAPNGPAPKHNGRGSKKSGTADADAEVRAANNAASPSGEEHVSDSDRAVSQAGTVASAGFPPGSAGSAWTTL